MCRKCFKLNKDGGRELHQIKMIDYEKLDYFLQNHKENSDLDKKM